jgi:hypothetical protein
MLTSKKFPLRDRVVAAEQLYRWENHYCITDAGWEALVAHRGWRTFEPDGDGGYTLTAPDGSIMATLVPGEMFGRRFGWRLPDGRVAPRLLTARQWLLAIQEREENP